MTWISKLATLSAATQLFFRQDTVNIVGRFLNENLKSSFGYIVSFVNENENSNDPDFWSDLEFYSAKKVTLNCAPKKKVHGSRHTTHDAPPTRFSHPCATCLQFSLLCNPWVNLVDNMWPFWPYLHWGLHFQEILRIFTTKTVTFPGVIWPFYHCFMCRDGDRAEMPAYFISLTEENRRQVKIVQAVQRESVST